MFDVFGGVYVVVQCCLYVGVLVLVGVVGQEQIVGGVFIEVLVWQVGVVQVVGCELLGGGFGFVVEQYGELVEVFDVEGGGVDVDVFGIGLYVVGQWCGWMLYDGYIGLQCLCEVGL